MEKLTDAMDFCNDQVACREDKSNGVVVVVVDVLGVITMKLRDFSF